MEPIDDNHFDQSSCRDEKVEAVDLLEECWFFENLLHGRPRMLRCYSDPCPSSNFGQEMLVRNSNGENSSSLLTSKVQEDNGFARPNLLRTPSLPRCIGRKYETREKESNKSGLSKLTRQLSHQSLLQTPTQQPCIGRKGVQEKEKDMGRSKVITVQSSRRNLLRTPSLPPCIRREGVQEKESDPRMSKLTPQASANPSHDLLPPRLTSKGMTQSSSIRGYRPPRNLEVGSIDTNGIKEMRRRYLNQMRMRKSPSDLEIEEVQGFKDLGFTFDKEDLSPTVVNILPGLKEIKNREDSDQDKVRRPYLSEAWLVQTCAPPIPNSAAKKSAEDVKAQIKFWARAVASDVRLEC